MKHTSCIGLLFLCQILPAQIRVPVLGFVFDAELKALRPIMGIPGAADLGTPLDAGFAMSSAAISSRQDYALAVGDDDRLVRLVRLGALPASSLAIEGIQPEPDRILLSPDGKAAALFYEKSRLLQVLSGLPDRPTRVRDVDLSFLTGPPSALAISDDGELVLAAGDSGLQLFQGGLPPRVVPVLGKIGALAFRSSSDDVVASAVDGSIVLIRGISQAGIYRTIATESAGLPNPIAANFSGDGSRVYVVSDDGRIGVFGEDGAGKFLSCECQAAGLFGMAGKNILRLNDPAQGPVKLLDTRQVPERVWFVPAQPIHSDSRRRRSFSER
jgi:hypothetical protein